MDRYLVNPLNNWIFKCILIKNPWDKEEIFKILENILNWIKMITDHNPRHADTSVLKKNLEF